MVDNNDNPGARHGADAKTLSVKSFSADFLQNVVGNSPDLIFAVDLRDLSLLYSNQDIFRHFGWPLDYWKLTAEQRSQQWAKMVHPDDAEILHNPQHLSEKLSRDSTLTANIRFLHADGHWVSYQTRCSRVEAKPGEPASAVIVARDVSELQRKDNEHRMAAKVFENSSDGIMLINSELEIAQVNPAMVQICGFSESELLGESPMGRIFPLRNPDEKVQDLTTDSGLLEQALLDGYAQGEDLGLRKSGDPFHSLTSITVLRDESDAVQSLIVTMRDITESKTHEERIRHLAYFDALTGLPNRTLFHDRLEHELQRCERNGLFAALLFLDLDKFKAINDTLGHAAGDKLLRIASERLKVNVRSEDTVARMSGDEFTIILSGRQSKEHVVAAATHVAQKILRELAEPFNLEGSEAFISVSVGVAVYPEDGMTSSMLLRNADTAMYFAKEAGKNNYQFYTPKMNAHSLEQLAFQNSLHKAVADQEFEVFFQPQYDYATQNMTTVESLLRWRLPNGELVSPMKFIPLAEQTGLIIRMGEWLIERSLWQFAEWRSMSIPIDRVAINLSARQFGDERLVEFVSDMLTKFQIPPQNVEFELTESVIMADMSVTRKVIENLKALGVSVAIDDFGTGYSSLLNLKQLPIDALKIDGSFVASLPGGREDQQIIKVILALAEGLGLRAIAEGVENAEQSAFLEALGCSAAQGYLYCGPKPAYELEQFVRQRLPSEEQQRSA